MGPRPNEGPGYSVNNGSIFLIRYELKAANKHHHQVSQNRQVWLRNATFGAFQQVCQNRQLLGGESPPKVWRHWASENATLAQNRHNWKPWFCLHSCGTVTFV